MLSLVFLWNQFLCHFHICNGNLALLSLFFFFKDVLPSFEIVIAEIWPFLEGLPQKSVEKERINCTCGLVRPITCKLYLRHLFTGVFPCSRRFDPHCLCCIQVIVFWIFWFYWYSFPIVFPRNKDYSCFFFGHDLHFTLHRGIICG